MTPPLARRLLLATTLFTLVAAFASPAPTPSHPQIQFAAVDDAVPDTPPRVTPRPSVREERRDIVSDVKSLASAGESYASGIVSSLSGIPDYFQSFPAGDAVASTLSLTDRDLDAIPTQALIIPPYANFTSEGWNVRFHGNIYKQPDISPEKLDDLTNAFLIDTSVDKLPENQANMARNVTSQIFVVQQANVAVSHINIGPFEDGPGLAQNITLPYNTTAEGDFDVFLPINSNGLTNGNETQRIQKLAAFVTNTTDGNATAYLVPNEGLTIISDIDDILRVTKIYDPKEGLLNSFARPYVPWQNMDQIYANWSASLPNAHFHYLTTLPEQVTRSYESFIYSTYPAGSFDTRPLNFSDISATLNIRQYLLTKIFQTFPQRKFVLVADTSNRDIMRVYPRMAHDYPNQVQCVFLRNTTATDSTDHFPYDTSGFKGLPQKQYMFFVNANDLSGINLAGDTCYNTSVPQNLTFSTQGLPLGLSDAAPINGSANGKVSNAIGLSPDLRLGAIALGMLLRQWL